MTLELPADVEPFLDNYTQIHDPAVYALDLSRPDDVLEAWAEVYDVQPDYMAELIAAESVTYVGATHDLLGRLEDHRDSEVRQAALLQVCDIEGLRDVHWFQDADRAFEREHGIAMQLANKYGDMYVHSR